MFLSFLIFFPLVGVLLITLVRDRKAAKWIATLITLVEFIVSVRIELWCCGHVCAEYGPIAAIAPPGT